MYLFYAKYFGDEFDQNEFFFTVIPMILFSFANFGDIFFFPVKRKIVSLNIIVVKTGGGLTPGGLTPGK